METTTETLIVWHRFDPMCKILIALVKFLFSKSLSRGKILYFSSSVQFSRNTTRLDGASVECAMDGNAFDQPTDGLMSRTCHGRHCCPRRERTILSYLPTFVYRYVLGIPSKLNNVRSLPDVSTSRCLRLLTASCLPRKEVIQPHLPIRLPCYDFTPIIGPTFDG